MQPCPLLCVLLQGRDLSENALLRSCELSVLAYSQGNQDPERCWEWPLIQAERGAELTLSAEEGMSSLRSVGYRDREGAQCAGPWNSGHLGTMGPLLGYAAQAQMAPLPLDS